MASVLKVDKLDPQSGTALEIGTSGDTISIPSGATLDISASTLTPPATMPASSGVNLTALNATQLTSGTIPDARFTTLPAVSGANLTSLTAGNLSSGTVPTARLGSGTASSSTVLYGDQTYKAEPGGDNTPSFSATHGNTPLASSATWTLVPYSTEVMDNGDCYDNSAGEYKFTPGVAGYYQVSSVLNWYAAAGNVTSITIALYKNGVEYISFRDVGFTTNQAAYYVGSSTYSGILNLSDSDYVQIYWNATYSSTAPSTNGLGAFSATKVII